MADDIDPRTEENTSQPAPGLLEDILDTSLTRREVLTLGAAGTAGLLVPGSTAAVVAAEAAAPVAAAAAALPLGIDLSMLLAMCQQGSELLLADGVDYALWLLLTGDPKSRRNPLELNEGRAALETIIREGNGVSLGATLHDCMVDALLTDQMSKMISSAGEDPKTQAGQWTKTLRGIVNTDQDQGMTSEQRTEAIRANMAAEQAQRAKARQILTAQLGHPEGDYDGTTVVELIMSRLKLVQGTWGVDAPPDQLHRRILRNLRQHGSEILKALGYEGDEALQRLRELENVANEACTRAAQDAAKDIQRYEEQAGNNVVEDTQTLRRRYELLSRLFPDHYPAIGAENFMHRHEEMRSRGNNDVPGR